MKRATNKPDSTSRMRPHHLLLLFVACGLFAGCSSFDRKWQAAGKPGPLAKATKWDGRWVSARHKTVSGKPVGGRLRCVYLPLDERCALATFHANWKIFSGTYEVPLASPPARAGTSRQLTGEHRLAAIYGGLYKYDATVSKDRFQARYSSSYDTGRFEMTRQLTNPTSIH